MKQGYEKSTQREKHPRRGWLIALIVVAVIIAGILIWWYGGQKAPDITGGSPPAGDTETPEEEVNMADHSDRDNRYRTILIVGYDQIGANTDTIMVARFDSVDKKLNVVSIPRDTLVNVSWSLKKINTIYQATGESIEGLKAGVEDILGFELDSYAFVDTSAFEKIVDCIGGLYFDVPCDMHYYDPRQNLTINIDKGYQWLSGENALKVCRYRWTYPMADIDRIKVQQDFLRAAIPQILNLGNALKVPELIKIIADNLQTDLTSGNIKWYMTRLLSLEADDVSFKTLPANNCCVINNVSYVSIYIDDWTETLNTYFNPLRNDIKPENCNILYQVSAEPGAYTLTPSNYIVTNGSALAGGLNSFVKYKG